jgi:hypothetical protein
MPGKKQPPAREVILAEILSQNRATIEPVQSTRDVGAARGERRRRRDR